MNEAALRRFIFEMMPEPVTKAQIWQAFGSGNAKRLQNLVDLVTRTRCGPVYLIVAPKPERHP